MKRLIAGLAVLAVAALGAPPVWAQQTDPYLIGGYGSPAALEGAFDVGSGKLAFLALAAPRACADGSDSTFCPFAVRAFFYNESCTRVDSAEASLTENGVLVLPVHEVTTATAGNYLVSRTSDANTIAGDSGTPDVVIGWLVQVDANRGIAWVEDPARMSGASGTGWSPYRPAAMVPFLPGDSGIFIVTLLFRCPTGVALINPALGYLQGTFATLGGDMLEAESTVDSGQAQGFAYSAASTRTGDGLCQPCSPTPSNFASSVTINFFDTNENPLGSLTTTCQCRTEPRLSTLFSGAGVSAFSTYLEIVGVPEAFNASGGDGLFTGSWNVQVVFGSTNLNLSDTFWSTRDASQLLP